MCEWVKETGNIFSCFSRVRVLVWLEVGLSLVHMLMATDISYNAELTIRCWSLYWNLRITSAVNLNVRCRKCPPWCRRLFRYLSPACFYFHSASELWDYTLDLSDCALCVDIIFSSRCLYHRAAFFAVFSHEDYYLLHYLVIATA